MNALENIERSLEQLSHNLRGGASPHGLQPRDVLHAILSSLEENRVEGLDHKLYAPNAYTVQLNLDDEERGRLLPFLGHEELEASIQRYCQEHKYNLRGPLCLDVVDAGITAQDADYPADLDPRGTRPKARPASARKVIVHSRFNVPPSWDSELASQFLTPAGPPAPMSDHDMDRRSPPTYAGSVNRS